jgi:hypothetical protein
MKVCRVLIFVAVILSVFTTKVVSQDSSLTPNILSLDENATSPPAKINDVAWIAGHWHGEAFGGMAEEIWSHPNNGTMMGMYRLIKDDSVVFYEFFTISEENGSLILRLKHFNPNLEGWEEKSESISFPLVKFDATNIYLDGMTFKREGEDKIHVFVRKRSKDGILGELKFHYQRSDPH